MTLRFDDPWWLLGLVLILPTAWLALRWLVAMSMARRWSVIVLRALLLAALLGMLAGASMIRRSDRVCVVACVDMSGSIRQFYEPGTSDGSSATALGTPNASTPRLVDRVRAFLEASSRSKRPDDLCGVVVFGAQPAATGMAQATGFRLPTSWPGPTLEEGTNIQDAVRLAAAMIPPDAAGRIVLFSDGVETAGSGLEAARAAAGESTNGSAAAPSPSRSRGSIPIDVVPLRYAVEHEVMVESADSPPTAAAGATVPVRVVLNATSRASGTLTLLREGRPIAVNAGTPGAGASDVRLTLESGRNVEVFRVALPEGRVHRFEAVWTPDPPVPGEPPTDTVQTNNSAQTVTVSPGRGSILIVDGVSNGSDGPGATLAATLARAGLQVQTVAPEAVKPDLLWLQEFDLVVLQNIPAEAMSRAAHAALAGAVTQLGIGLVMVGGPDSFGPGGWKGTDIEPLLPVKLDLPEKLVTPAAAVVLVIDNSGSMNRPVMGSNRSQQDIADEGAALAVESMDKSDLVGVITFNNDYTVEVPLGPNKDAKATAKLIRSIGADGGTNMPPALREAHHQIKSATAELKHVIVLSDGESMGKSELPGIVEEMRADGIMVSTIAIGNDADVTVMRDMARLGKGEFYRVIDPTVLPRVLLKAVRIVRSPLIREGEFTPVVVPSGSPVMEGLAEAFGGGIAPLGGLVLTQARSEPTVVYTLATPKREGAEGGGEPILGYWSAGLGRVAAFTSDAHDKWAAPWLAANNGSGFARFWTQLARTIARPPGSTRSQELTATLDGDRMTIRLEASEDAATAASGGGPAPRAGRPLDALTVPGTVYGPDGSRQDVQLAQVGPGTYEASVDLRPAAASSVGPERERLGAYVVTLAPRRVVNGQPQLLAPVVGGVVKPAGQEYRVFRSDNRLLDAIAKATGGRTYELAAITPTTPVASAPDLFSRNGLKPAESRTPLWPTLAIAAVVLMLLDVGTRRVAWDRLLSREMGAELSRSVSAALRDRTAQAAATMDRLRKPDELAPDGPEQGPAIGPLGESDAEEIRLRERARRRETRAAAAQPRPESALAREAPSDVEPAPPPAQPDVPDEHGLLAAKRRAQRRMEE